MFLRLVNLFSDYCDFGLERTHRGVTSLAWGAGLEALRLVLAAGASFRQAYTVNTGVYSVLI
jgi:hypothetical protein